MCVVCTCWCYLDVEEVGHECVSGSVVERRNGICIGGDNRAVCVQDMSVVRGVYARYEWSGGVVTVKEEEEETK
jgi:hypothetical protein